LGGRIFSNRWCAKKEIWIEESMFKLLKNVECYAPEYLGKQDILIVLDKIAGIFPSFRPEQLYQVDVMDCRDKIACPGFIDAHVHISGGGGEDGPQSIIGPIDASALIAAGITTVVGLLGADPVAKSPEGLLMKARALEAQGLSTFIYSGHYGVPPVTLTGRILTDVALIDKVIGAGEIALSDHRSSMPSLQELMNLAYEAHMGGMLGGKAGLVHFHLGNGKEGLGPLLELVEESEYPVSMFVPTHVNRNRSLFKQALHYRASGGNIDLTAGTSTGEGYSVPEGLKQLADSGSGLERVTVTSDGNGSGAGASGKEVGNVKALFEDIRTAVQQYRLPLEEALKPVTVNAAQVLKLDRRKGRLAAGFDADIAVLDGASLRLEKLFAGGRHLLDGGLPVPGEK
jgi:beta-aspartyl-dipeptidase (metallo-type)